MTNLENFTDVLGEVDEICDSQPFSLPSSSSIGRTQHDLIDQVRTKTMRPSRGTGRRGEFRCIEEIDKSMVVCAPTGSGKTVIFEMAIVQLLIELDDRNYTDDFKMIYMAPVKALCTERLTEWYPKFTKLGLMCIEVTGDTNVDFSQLKPYKLIITTPEKWDMLTRRWRDHRGLVEMIKLFMIDEVHILNDEARGPVLEAVVSRMKTIESSAQSDHRIEQLKQQYGDTEKSMTNNESSGPRIRFVAVSATVSNPDEVATWLGTTEKPAVFYKFGDECRPVKIKRIVEGYPCSEGTSIFKFDIILNYKLWPVIQKYHDGKPTLIFCNTRKSVALTADTLSRELTISFTPEQKAKLTALASNIKNKKLQALVLSGVGCHHAGLLYEERLNIEQAFKNRDLPILITTTTLAMGVNLPAHLVIVKNTQQYVNGAYQEYSISTVLQMVGRAGRPQFDTEATAVIMTRLSDKARYQALVGGSEPLQSYLHKRLAENLNSEAALGTVTDVAQCVQWLCSTFLYVRAARDPKRYLGLPPAAPAHHISKKIEELCVKAMNGLASAGMITMDEASCIESTEAGRLMSIYYLDLETMKHIMKIEGTESLEKLLWVICESHELADMHLRVDERRVLNALNRNNAAATIRFPMKGKIMSRQMKVNCMIQAILGCLPIPDPSLHQEAMKIMRIADRVCKCLVAYVTRPDLTSTQPQYFSAILNSLILAKCLAAHLWENSPYVSKQLKGIGPTFSTLLATAGKTNFLLLEESHPRDLERIMNKGAPAGNVLRKQISFLPKYQITMTPIDEKRVSMQLVLLNQAYLAQNMEHLTARNTHKCYVVVGDSENYLICLTSFKDKDLISIYAGTITHEITRKHSFEHKLFVHCISTDFVGIDTQCEYTFKDLYPMHTRGDACTAYPIEERPTAKTGKKQTTVTDVYKQRKRKNNEEIIQSKEKKKRDIALLEKFRYLKESFSIASKEINEELQEAAQVSKKIMQEMIPSNKPSTSATMNDGINDTDTFYDVDKIAKGTTDNYDSKFPEMVTGDDNDCFVVDDRIDSILNEIENEIYKNKLSEDQKSSMYNNTTFKSQIDTAKNSNQVQSSIFSEAKNNQVLKKVLAINNSYSYQSAKQKGKRSNLKSNYNFIDLLEKNENLSDDDETDKVRPKQGTSFSDTIKSEIEKFLQRTKNSSSIINTDVNVKELLEKEIDIQDTNLIKGRLAVTLPEKHFTVKGKEDNSTDIKDGKRKDGLPESNFENYEKKDLIDFVDLINNSTENLSDSLTKNKQSVINEPHIVEANVNNGYDKKKQDDTLQKDDFDGIVNNINHSILGPEIENNHNESSIVHDSKLRLDPDFGKQIDKLSGNDHSVKYINIYGTNNMFNQVCPNNNKIKKNERHLRLKNSSNIENFKPADKHTTLLYESFIPKSINLYENSAFANKIEKKTNPHSDMITNQISKDLLSIRDSKKVIDQLKTQASNKIIETYIPELQTLNPIKSTQYHSLNVSTDSKYLTNNDNNPKINKNFGNSTEKQNNINQYSYTATKIDVCFKKTAEHQVQIVRKLKLDLNYTEIISKSNECGNKDNKSDLTDIASNDGIDDININSFELSKPSNMIHQEMEESKFDDLKYSANNETDNLKNVDTLVKGRYTTAKTSGNHLIKDRTAEKTNEDQSPKHVPNKDAEIIKPEIGCTNDSLSKHITSSPANSEIGRILQKYSTILRKTGSEFSNKDSENCVSNNNVIEATKPKISKIKRPYKISEIHNLDVTLPKSFKIEVSRSSNPNCDDILTRIGFMDHTDIRNKENIIHYKMPQGALVEEKLHEDISGHHSPVSQMISEPSTDFKIDQSMFNPKTLLQCFSTQEPDEIIPPPAEFCDTESIYSPKQIKDTYDFHALDNPVNYDYDNDEPPYEYYNASNEAFPEHDTSIFEENIHQDTILTPTKEIETWSLPQDDSWEANNPYQHYNNLKSFTIMRNNSPIDRPSSSSPSQSYFHSRNAKLGQFKFKHKNKLRM